MLKLAILIWSILAVAFAGTLILIVLVVTSTAQADARAIPIAAGIGALLAIPAAIFVSKRILALSSPGR
ncbi:hypothetical protein V5F53_04495 [Xanthobacter sp. V4C-4]|uniref:hypothetical protein n=1 Tax=Xanthobacter cornucopiae TaxID=3119924 RepID=UPI0037293A85